MIILSGNLFAGDNTLIHISHNTTVTNFDALTTSTSSEAATPSNSNFTSIHITNATTITGLEHVFEASQAQKTTSNQPIVVEKTEQLKKRIAKQNNKRSDTVTQEFQFSRHPFQSPLKYNIQYGCFAAVSTTSNYNLKKNIATAVGKNQLLKTELYVSSNQVPTLVNTPFCANHHWEPYFFSLPPPFIS